MQFQALQLNDALVRAVKKQGYTEATPIQEQAIPHLLAGRDLIGLAQTGTGKTAAFTLPTLHHLAERTDGRRKHDRRHIRALILAPTRELAAQIGASVNDYGTYTRLKSTVIFGGVSIKPQIQTIKRGVDVLIATPGRLLDLMGRGIVRCDKLEVLILDEADRMFDMGFMPDVRKIVAQVPQQRQTLLFSATMPPDIKQLTSEILLDPVTVAVAPESTTVEAINQRVYFVEKTQKRALLEYLLIEHNMHRTLVFTRTKHRADSLTKKLRKAKIQAATIHGDRSQRQRQRALEDFRRGKLHVLVATDIVARGIDVDDISHVVNYDLPNETESYVHRIGRTGRAGADGVAIAFCDADERRYLRDIERLVQMHIPVVEEHPFASHVAPPRPTDLHGKRRSSNGNGKNSRRRKSRNGNKRRSNNGGNGNGRKRSQKRRDQQRQKSTT